LALIRSLWQCYQWPELPTTWHHHASDGYIR